MANILIAGDSWGCGEFGWYASPDELNLAWKKFYNSVKGADYPPAPLYSNWMNLPAFVLLELKTKFNFLGDETLLPYLISPAPWKLLHRGLEHYLIESGHIVTNISMQGESNNYIINAIRSQESLKLFDVIFYFQTDPVRDLWPYTNFKKDFSTYKQLVLWQNSQLNTTYTQLNQLGSEIYMLGGCSKLNLSLLSKHKNLIPLFESIPEFLLPNYSHPEIWFSNWYKLVDRQFDIDSLDKLVYNKGVQDSLANYRDLFWPDGQHPNRFGHKKIFDYINENIFRQS